MSDKDTKIEKVLNHVPEIISEKDKEMLSVVPTREEVKNAVFSLKGCSAFGPYVFWGIFYQHYRKIVGLDVFNMVKDFCRWHPSKVYYPHKFGFDSKGVSRQLYRFQTY